jgi:hypothetical protein
MLCGVLSMRNLVSQPVTPIGIYYDDPSVA